jgi:thiamine pyrophosphate-dependent acetolactate synthase large subunit-like protein
MARRSIADVLVDTLVARGVERISGVAGDSVNGITDSIRRRERIGWGSVRHEETAGLLGQTAEAPEQVRPMVTAALKHDGPALVEVLVHRQELAMPPTISLEQMTGFSLFMLKAVLSGCGDEVIDLARVNLFR